MSDFTIDDDEIREPDCQEELAAMYQQEAKDLRAKLTRAAGQRDTLLAAARAMLDAPSKSKEMVGAWAHLWDVVNDVEDHPI